MKISKIGLLFAAFAAHAAPGLSAAQAAPGAPAAADTPAAAGANRHERLLPLEGGRNFRDLGGYRTADGHTVKWGMLFRSGSMHFLTAKDYAYLSGIGLRDIVDFRDNNERKAEPTLWPAGKNLTYLSTDYENVQGGLMPISGMQSWTADQARQVMRSTYPKMLQSFAPQYKRLFAELLSGHEPLAFNCSAGKDRTGIASALVLTALGVPRKTIVEDYLLTNKYLNPQAVMAQSGTTMSANAPNGQSWFSLPPEVLQAFSAADRSYIEAALDQLEAHPGGAMGYLKDEMGLDDAQIKKLRSMYLD